MAATSAVTPLSWTVPNWYIDPANGTGCASNGNSCTSATCAGPGIGPCVTAQEIIAQRWGTPSPILAQTTTFNALSGETVGQEEIVVSPTMVQATTFGVIGTLALVATFNLGTVTAKNRATPQLLESTGFTAAGLAVGQIVINPAEGSSRAIVENLSGGTATLSQPLAPLTIANAGFAPQPAENDAWASGQSVNVYSMPTLNLQVVNPQGGDNNLASTTGAAWIQYVSVPDWSGTDGDSNVQIGGPSAIYTSIVDSAIHPYTLTTEGPYGHYGTTLIGDYMPGGGTYTNATIIGGVIGLGCSAGNQMFIDGDCIVESTIYVDGVSAAVGYAYVGTGPGGENNGLLLQYGATFELDGGLYGIGLYGPGGANVQSGCSLLLDSSTVSWTQGLLLTGGLRINSGFTGSSYSSGTWTDGRALNVTNLDLYTGLQNPVTGARYSKT
jgi:hypothetical protein